MVLERHTMMKHVTGCMVIGLMLLSMAVRTRAVMQDDSPAGAQSAKALSSLDPAVRQSAAEELARMVAMEQKKLVEGYLLQEKDKRVRLALNWALYRMGKSALLFQIVRDLDSSRHEQAVSYLIQLEGAEPLYVFLKQETTRPKVIIGVIEVLGRIGDTEALQQIKPFVDSFDPKVSETAELSINMINHRLGEAEPATKTRPRTTATPEQP
jgi:HEAT repeat protein